MAKRRWYSLACLLSFVGGLVLAQPAVAQSAGSYFTPSGASFDGLAQARTGSILPQVIGGVTGLAIGGATFGVVGAVAGAAGGYALGQALGNKYDPGQPLGYPQRVNNSVLATIIPGVAGAVLGVALFAGAGPMGWIMAGMTGFALGNLVARLLFPQLYYGGAFTPMARTFSSPTVTGQMAPVVGRFSNAVAVPQAPSSPAQDLGQLRDTFIDAMRAYVRALSAGSVDVKQNTREAYEKARKAYDDAKAAALQ